MKEHQMRAMPRDTDADEPPPLELEIETPVASHARATKLTGSRSQQNRGDNQLEDASAHDDDGDTEADTPSLMDEIVATAQRAKEAKRRQQERERNSESFGRGLRRGFFAAKPARAAASPSTMQPSQQSQQQQKEKKKMPTREDLLIVKPATQQQQQSAAPAAQSPFVFPEVQSALEGMRQLDPKAWMDAKFFDKLAHNPRLARSLQDPRFTQAIDELQRDPEAAVRKYRSDAAVSAMLQEFMGFLGSHFEELGKQQAAAAQTQQQQASDASAREKAVLVQPAPPQAPTAAAACISNATASTKSSGSAGIVDLDAARHAAVADMQRSPEEEAQVQKILQSPELLQALSDAELMRRLRACADSPQELRRLQTDPALARKLQLLVDAQLVRFE